METLTSKLGRIEAAVADAVRTGAASEAEIRRVLYALSLAGWDVAYQDPRNRQG